MMRGPAPRAAAIGCCAAALLAGGGCTSREPTAGLGRRVAEGEALAVRASPDGAWIAWLERCTPLKDRTLPPGNATCALAVARADGTSAQRLATGVPTLPHGVAWSADGTALAALAEYDAAAAAGALVVWAPGGDARVVAEGVTFYAFARSGHALGLVARGRLLVADGTATPVPVDAGDGIATLELGGDLLLARRVHRSGGDLVAVRGGRATALAQPVREYAFSRDGRRFAFTGGSADALHVAWDGGRPAAPLGRDVREFRFSPRGDAVAYVADAAPGRQGDLLVALEKGRPLRVAQRVGEPRWSADGDQLAWLEEYDPRSRTGTLAAGRPGGERRVLARHVSDFDLAPSGGAVAYLQHETAGGYSVDLGLARAGAEPAKVARGAFGFSFSPDGRWLYYRTGCVREGEACDLLRVAVAAADAKPETVAEGVKSFEFAPGRPDRLLVSWARKDRVALDLAIWEGGKLTAVDTYVRPGTAAFVGGARRVSYAVLDRGRQGVYLAELP